MYRNSVVRRIRQQLKSTFPDDWEQRLRHPFSDDEWDTITKKAEERRITGEIATPIIDPFDYLSVSHFYNLFDSYFDIILPPKPGHRRPQKAHVLKSIKEVKDFRDPLSHPGEIEFSIWDALIMIDSGRRIVSLFDTETAVEMEKLARALFGADFGLGIGREPLEDTLPPRESIVSNFIGRQEELAQLHRWFSDSESKRWVLVGDGGKGKTSIAYQFAVEMKYSAPKPFYIILWLSTKRRKFVEGTTIPIETPDFTDLSTAIDRLLIDYGWSEEISKPMPEKQKQLLQLFEEFPALLVVDDLETLEGEADDAIEFFTFHTPQTKSKVLITSRRLLFGLGSTATIIQGFNHEEGHEFILSRLRLFGMESTGYSKADFDEIIRVTDSSPLYIEDLLRLCATGLHVSSAITLWKDSGGDNAREFALKREFEMLSEDARSILLGCSLSQQPCTTTELQAITNLSESRVLNAIGELQRMFLVPKPRIVEGSPTFSVNANTRILVLDTMHETENYRRVEASLRALSGKLELSGKLRAEVAALIRYTAAQFNLGKQKEAERILKEVALEKYPNHPDLLAQLAWLYMQWKPARRITDAREYFQRAAQLKCRRASMYYHWWRLECSEREWSSAARVASTGRKIISDNWHLRYYEGYARSRLGRELISGFSSSKGMSELTKAQYLLEDALVPVEELSAGEYSLHSDLLRALVLNCEALNDVKGMRIYLVQWLHEHPDDPICIAERDRLLRKFPGLRLSKHKDA